MTGLGNDLRLLRRGSFLALFGGRTASMIAYAFAPVALAFGVLALPGSTPATLSIVLACESIPMIVLMLIGGVIADRMPKERVLLAGVGLGVIAFVALAFLMWIDQSAETVSIWPMGLASVVSGVGLALMWPAFMGLIPEVVPAADLQTGNALLAMGANIARIAGLVLAGMVVAAFGGPAGLAVTAGFLVITAICLAFIRPPAAAALPVAGGTEWENPRTDLEGRGVGLEAPAWPAEGAERVAEPLPDEAIGRASLTPHSIWSDLRDGWGEFSSREWLWVVVLQWAFLILVFNAAHGVLGPVLAAQELGGAQGWSRVLAAEAVGALVGVVVALRLKPRRPILLPVLLTIPTIPLPWILLGLDAPLWSVVGAAFAMGIVFELFGILWTTTMQREVPPEALARVSSYDGVGSMMFGPIGLLIAGPVAATVGVKRALVGAGVLLVVIGLAAVASKGVREMTWHEEPAGD